MEDVAVTEIRHEFEVMGTFAEFLVRAEEEVARPLIERAEQDLHRWSAQLTRFDPSSELERLNAAGTATVTGALRDILALASQAWAMTDGRFDIGIGTEIASAGYDRTFDELDAPSEGEIVAAARTRAADASGERVGSWVPPFELDAAGEVRIRSGSRLDLGGIAKGWAADMTCVTLAAAGPCVVNLGGDIAMWAAPGEEPWAIGLHVGDSYPMFAFTHGGIATSGQDRRAWRSAETGAVEHHLIDPRLGRPAPTDILRLSVLAGSCVEAEMWSKALMMERHEDAHAEAERRGLTTTITGLDGRVTWTGDLERLRQA